MRQDIAMKWAQALESGHYEQGKGRLNAEGKLCCLGVLCELLGVEKTPSDGHPDIFSYGDPPNFAILSREAMAASGLKTNDGRLRSLKTTLTNLNDTAHDFPAIAAVIREKWEEL